MNAIDLDRELDGIVAGDPDAFGRWVAGAEPPLRASLRPLATRVDCEAVLQEALLRVWQVAPRCRRDDKPNALLRLALRIARNLAIDELRRARTSGDDETVEAALARAAAVEPLAPDPLLRRTIDDCRRKLPAKPAAALEARIESAGGDADAVLAERLRMKLNTFLQNVTRAKKLLADCLRAHGVELEDSA